MRKALIVGINHYDHITSLYGCVNDALAVSEIFEQHGNAGRDKNFRTPRLMTAANANEAISRRELKDAVRELFAGDAEIALLYFAGHGYIDDIGGYLCASDCESGDDGLSLDEVMTLANTSEATNKVIILDSCHSGVTGSRATQPGISELNEG